MPQSSLMSWLNQPDGVTAQPDLQQPASGRQDPKANTRPLPEQNSDSSIRNGPEPDGQEKVLFGSVLKPLPPNVELRSCTKEDLVQLKNLTSLLLPIPYPERFFREIVDDEVAQNITLLAVWYDDPLGKGTAKGRLVGAMRCRLLAHPPNSEQRGGPPMLYLSTLTLLSPFRGHGIATHLLMVLVRRAVEDYGITTVGAHVWEANTDGLSWYRKRGFREVGRESGYYRRLDPQGAVILQRDVSVMDFLGCTAPGPG